MYCVKNTAGVRRLAFGAICLFVLGVICLSSFGNARSCLAGDKGPLTDVAGQRAFQLWLERERDRAVADSARRYLDYLLRQPGSAFTSEGLWEELEQVQKWLKDPDHTSIPEPSPELPHRPQVLPPYPYYPYAYPPYPYYPSQYAPPAYWPPSYYYTPQENVHDGGKRSVGGESSTKDEK